MWLKKIPGSLVGHDLASVKGHNEQPHRNSRRRRRNIWFKNIFCIALKTRPQSKPREMSPARAYLKARSRVLLWTNHHYKSVSGPELSAGPGVRPSPEQTIMGMGLEHLTRGMWPQHLNNTQPTFLRVHIKEDGEFKQGHLSLKK